MAHSLCGRVEEHALDIVYVNATFYVKHGVRSSTWS